MEKIAAHMDLLGRKVKEKITGVEGTVTSVCFDLYGCIQACVHQGVDGTGKIREQNWFDVSRLEVIPSDRVMDPPQYDWTPQVVADGGKGPNESRPETGV
jgi:hypothetical protein